MKQEERGKERKSEFKETKTCRQKAFKLQGHTDTVYSAYMGMSESNALTEADVGVIEFIHVPRGGTGPSLDYCVCHSLILPKSTPTNNI